MSALAEDSGEGVVLLVYGGDEGLRLQPAESGDDWDLANPAQWGEACLMLAEEKTPGGIADSISQLNRPSRKN
ncbi:MAG: hypothetical protein CM1200mP22_06420 [Dehalococcoidia bacterium]|nr:MAG: hypothetical protein CM1200mP22_06420 [Dehalococcoidia bacterium]